MRSIGAVWRHMLQLKLLNPYPPRKARPPLSLRREYRDPRGAQCDCPQCKCRRVPKFGEIAAGVVRHFGTPRIRVPAPGHQLPRARPAHEAALRTSENLTYAKFAGRLRLGMRNARGEGAGP